MDTNRASLLKSLNHGHLKTFGNGSGATHKKLLNFQLVNLLIANGKSCYESLSFPLGSFQKFKKLSTPTTDGGMTHFGAPNKQDTM